MPVINIKGIELSEQEAAYRPKKYVKTDILSLSTHTAGKIFAGIEILKNGAPFALQMLFDGQPVEIKDNEKGMNSNGQYTEGRFESYAVDLPMRLVTVREQPHTIQFLIGIYESEKFIEKGKSDIFELCTRTEGHDISPKVDPADSD